MGRSKKQGETVSNLTLRVTAQVTALPRRELGVLITLLRNQGRLVPRRKLEEAVYSFDKEVTPNAILRKCRHGDENRPVPNKNSNSE